MITHIFFDAGNTLVHPNFNLVAQALERRGARTDVAALVAAELVIRARLDTPDIIRTTNDGSRWGLYFTEILKHCGIVDRGIVDPALEELRAIHRESNLWEVVQDDVVPALERLRKRYRMAVVSNANGTVREKLRRVGLLPYFEFVLDSHEEGVEKPDPRIFRTALERAGARPEASVYVGDLYHVDVAGARAAGMVPVLLDPADAHRGRDVARVPSMTALAASIDGLLGTAL